MSRRNRAAMASRAGAQAEQAASEAGRTLQAQRSFDADAGGSTEPAVENNVPDEAEAPKIDPSANIRNRVMEEIISKRGKETAHVEPEPENAEVPQAKTLDAIQAEPSVAGAESTAAAPVTAPIKTVRVKVDGEEFDAPEDEVNEAGGVRAYQREKASENRLRKSNETLAEAKQLQAQIADLVRKQTEAANPPEKTNIQVTQELVDTIRYGSPEESAAALQTVISTSAQKVDPNAIVWQAVSVMQQQAAETAFVQEFADIVHNPMLLRLVMGLKQERIANNQGTNDWPTFYRSIGNEVRSAIGKQNQPATALAAQGTTPDSTSQGSTDKEARKASIVNIPTAAARAALAEPEKPETRAEILNNMRKSRGIQTG